MAPRSWLSHPKTTCIHSFIQLCSSGLHSRKHHIVDNTWQVTACVSVLRFNGVGSAITRTHARTHNTNARSVAQRETTDHHAGQSPFNHCQHKSHRLSATRTAGASQIRTCTAMRAGLLSSSRRFRSVPANVSASNDGVRCLLSERRSAPFITGHDHTHTQGQVLYARRTSVERGL